jgi:seryl-tRNA synthetase
MEPADNPDLSTSVHNALNGVTALSGRLQLLRRKMARGLPVSSPQVVTTLVDLDSESRSLASQIVEMNQQQDALAERLVAAQTCLKEVRTAIQSAPVDIPAIVESIDQVMSPGDARNPGVS